ncbi:glycosyltransferase family 4 protein [Phocaeicola sp.]
MKILYIYKALASWGGIERILVDKMNNLVDKYGYEIYMITTDQGNHKIPFKLDERVTYKDLHIRFHTQYALPLYRRFFERRRLQKLFEQRLQHAINEINPDIIVCIADLFVDTLVRVNRSIPLVVESHSMKAYTATLGYRPLKWWEKCRRNIYLNKIKKASIIAALTRKDAEEWKDINPSTIVIPNMVHLNPTGRYSCCQNKKVIFVGRFANQKGIDQLLAIWQTVHKRHPDWQLDIYGEGELKENYVSIINSYDHQLNIHVYPPTLNIFDKYIESSIFVLTSKYEPFGLVIPEAMSCGLPVVSFDCPYGPADIITADQDGFLIQNGDIDKFANKVCYLIENPDVRKQMGEKAIRNAQRYSADIIMPMWKELFENLTIKKQ